MSFSELELKRIDSMVGILCRRLSPPQHADKLRFLFEVDGHRVTIYEERPPWRGTGKWTRHGVARFRFVRKTGEWMLYWIRADFKWHLYDPGAVPRDLESLLTIVDEDENGAFFG